MKLRRIFLVLLVVTGAAALWLSYADTPAGHLARSLVARHVPALDRSLRDLPARPLGERLAEKGFALGQPVLIRIFKEENQLELWMERQGRYELAMSYPVCAWSGELGPKLREGDGQSPEGFYFASAAQLKPDSRYYRAINVGFPNAFDRQHGRSGSFLMIHGNCVSIGYYAMTDAGIDD
ncbi:MAG: hypothetical protein FJX63_06475, partial [Alphaproteobacteria bacterium]|nr:hypothetical protein [Alphaproteobacteria bacterium]